MDRGLNLRNHSRCDNHFCSPLCLYFYFRSLVMKLYFFSGLYSLHEATQSMKIILTCAFSRPSSESCRFTRTDQRQKRYILCTFLTSFLNLNKKRSCHFDTSGLFHSVSCHSKQKTMHRSFRSPSTYAFSVTSFLDLMAFSIKVKEKSLGKEIECNLIRPQPKII